MSNYLKKDLRKRSKKVLGLAHSNSFHKVETSVLLILINILINLKFDNKIKYTV